MTGTRATWLESFQHESFRQSSGGVGGGSAGATCANVQVECMCRVSGVRLEWRLPAHQPKQGCPGEQPVTHTLPVWPEMSTCTTLAV